MQHDQLERLRRLAAQGDDEALERLIRLARRAGLDAAMRDELEAALERALAASFAAGDAARALDLIPHMRPTPPLWDTLCALVDLLIPHAPQPDPDAALRPRLAPLASRLDDAWPDALRVAPPRWWQAASPGIPAPHMTLVRALDLSGDLDPDTLNALATLTPPLTLRALRVAPTPGVPRIGHLRKALFTLLAAPGLTSLDALALPNLRLHDEGALTLTQLPIARSVSSLDLSGNRLFDRGLHALFDACPWPRLRALTLGDNLLTISAVVALLKAAHIPPLTALSLRDNEGLGHPRAMELLGRGARWMSSLRALDLAGCSVNARGVALLAPNPFLDHLSTLDLSNNPLASAGAHALTSASLPALSRLNLADCHVGDAGVSALLSWPALAHLSALDLRGCLLGPHALGLLGRTPSLAALRDLDLSDNPLDDRAAYAFSNGRALRLERLVMRRCDLSDAALDDLLRARSMRTLRVLDLGDRPERPLNPLDLRTFEPSHPTRLGPPNALTARACERLIASLTRRRTPLTRLDLGGNPIGDPGAALLADAPALSSLRALALPRCDLSAAAAAALAQSPHLANLRLLDLRGNPIGAPGARALASMSHLHTLLLDPDDVGPYGASTLAGSTALSPAIRAHFSALRALQ